MAFIPIPGRHMMQTFLDHLVVTAPSLEAGAVHVEARLGVRPGPGGRHPRMGTHNRLLPLGPDQYLEVIAVDPEAPPPGHPRWFGLDQVRPGDAPRLAGWVARTEGLAELPAGAEALFGTPAAMSRGSLAWRITLPAGGGLPFDGIGPLLIQWPEGVHPARGMAPGGCTLEALEGCHPQADELQRWLRLLGFQGPLALRRPSPGEPPGLKATILTPAGTRTL
jgi:hypothetical protein